MGIAENTTETKDAEKIFLELAIKTRGMSPVEQIAVISEVEILQRPRFHTHDMNFNGLYIKDGRVMLWETYALKIISELSRVENHKNQPLYQ